MKSYEHEEEYTMLQGIVDEVTEKFINSEATWAEVEAAEEALQSFIEDWYMAKDAEYYCDCAEDAPCIQCCGKCKHVN